MLQAIMDAISVSHHSLRIFTTKLNISNIFSESFGPNIWFDDISDDHKWSKLFQRKYGVVMRGGITRFESGTASNNFGVLVSTSENSNILATFPHR